LTSRFGEEQVFMDLDMEPGVDFVEQINEAVASCRLLIAVIGPRWATAEDAQGRRRLDDPADFIRVEVEAGLRQADVRVVPVLVHGAQMPSAEELPPALADLARRNALELSDARWNYDVDRLASTAERVLARPPTAQPPTDAPGGG
jgi:TIR domain